MLWTQPLSIIKAGLCSGVKWHDIECWLRINTGICSACLIRNAESSSTIPSVTMITT
jgi:hypothetical protein